MQKGLLTAAVASRELAKQYAMRRTAFINHRPKHVRHATHHEEARIDHFPLGDDVFAPLHDILAHNCGLRGYVLAVPVGKDWERRQKRLLVCNMLLRERIEGRRIVLLSIFSGYFQESYFLGFSFLAMVQRMILSCYCRYSLALSVVWQWDHAVPNLRKVRSGA